jgi:hypothetical protein
MTRAQKPRDVGVAGLPDLLASADGDCDTSFLNPTTSRSQAASEATPRRAGGTVYLLRLQVRPDVDDIRALRWLLKKLLRQNGFRCVTVRRET